MDDGRLSVHPARNTQDNEQCQRQQQPAAVILDDPQRNHQPEDVAPHQHPEGARQAETPVSQGREKTVGQREGQPAEERNKQIPGEELEHGE